MPIAMTTPNLPALCAAPHARVPCTRLPNRQRGVVLIIAMIMLIVISLLAVRSMRNASSTETISGNVRTTELATQAAEIALRHCEASVVNVVAVAGGGTPTYSTTFVASNILPASTTTSAQWQDTTVWDSTSTAAYVLPLTMVNQTGLTSTYKRAPECMVEPLPTMMTATGAVSTTASFVITARGFGPEVANNRNRPLGSEVWLQSHIELE